jgi:hypothetical protein
MFQSYYSTAENIQNLTPNFFNQINEQRNLSQFNITYPNYKPFYKDIDTVAKLIEQQNVGILKAWDYYEGFEPKTNIEICDYLGLVYPNGYQQVFADNDIKVKII